MITLAPLDQVHPDAVEQLLDAAFGPDRHGRTAYRLREGMAEIPALSFAALEEETLLGSIQCWPVTLAGDGGATDPLVLVGPVAVRPDRQRDGIGRMLMERMIEAATETGETALVLIGDPEYYGRFFGFTADATAGWTLPGPFEPRRLLARLTDGRTLAARGALGPRRAMAGA
ncbi:GNAT family N-acetyltransferase [Sphingomonas oleivorans]|uniref:GNAT family N-acetyltransferase n=1 Tax=Sphingomonas oleivorans TaxID=1735121 RepID=A0A2T5G1I3_9SPHN|nr:N-acetyltransferase [Sphingomonas oleivorans]PTQ13004.1 GNAT family N-acetyltransferase [Sphingomonas oleivorans]